MKVYVGDTGTVITLDCEEDVTAATSLKILARRPAGNVVEWTATQSATTTISYTTESDSLDQAGLWRLQAYVTLPSGTWRGETATLEVHPAFG